MGTSNSRYKFQPENLIVLGAGNMPGESNMLRLYYTAQIARKFEFKKIIIAQPKDGDNLELMKQFLVNFGITPERIEFEAEGENTREQVLNVAKKFPEVVHSRDLIITSPEHMRRSMMVFRKAGFSNIGGFSTFERSLTGDISFNAKSLGGRKFVPDVGNFIGLRYNMWTYLGYEVSCFREFCAIFYYWLQGWV